ncbi:MAG TPA: hypothetical protein VHZ54_12625 [Solirubrobacterales bacterium]|jgi:hypothetical protein|nr:hypothetical protein [Solirubrobacterales bacterium]
MTKTRWLISGSIAVIVIAAVAAVWVTKSDGSNLHGPQAMVKAAGWLSEEEGCPGEIELQTSRIPVGPDGPPGTFFETFGGVPEDGALASCGERIGAYIGWFRFADVKAMEGALGRHPEITEDQPTCTHGPELLLESWLGHEAFVAGYCRRLGFAVHRPTG